MKLIQYMSDLVHDIAVKAINHMEGWQIMVVAVALILCVAFTPSHTLVEKLKAAVERWLKK